MPRRLMVKSITKNKTLSRTLADIGKEETGRADFAAHGCGGVGKPDERHAEKTEVGVNKRDGFIDVDPRVRREELPFGVFWVADGDPGAVDQVDVSWEPLDVPCFEVKRIIGNQECGIRPPLDLDVSANVVKEAVSGADVVASFVGFEVLIAVIELNVAGSGGFVGFAVVFDVVGAKTGVRVVNVHIAVCRGDVALAALRFRF